MKNKNLILLMVVNITALAQAPYDSVEIKQALVGKSNNTDDPSKLSRLFQGFGPEDQDTFEGLLNGLKQSEFAQAILNLYTSCPNNLLVKESVQKCAEGSWSDFSFPIPIYKIDQLLTDTQLQARNTIFPHYLNLTEGKLGLLLPEIDRVSLSLFFGGEFRPDSLFNFDIPRAGLALIFLTYELTTYTWGKQKGVDKWSCSYGVSKIMEIFKNSNGYNSVMLCLLRDIIMVLDPEDPITVFTSVLNGSLQVSEDERVTVRDIITPVIKPLMEDRSEQITQAILSHLIACAQYSLITQNNKAEVDMYAVCWFVLALNSGDAWQRITTRFMQLPVFAKLNPLIMSKMYKLDRRLDMGDFVSIDHKNNRVYEWRDGGFILERK